jgi:MFS family permease
MYPTFLREALKYSPATAGTVMSMYGLGALVSIGGGWLGDRFSPRIVLSVAFFATAVLGYLLFHTSGAVTEQVILSFIWGVVVSGTIYVNLAGYLVKSLRSNLSSRGSGIFVTTLYGSASIAGYVMGWIATRGGWAMAGAVQFTFLSVIAAGLALALRPKEA